MRLLPLFDRVKGSFLRVFAPPSPPSIATLGFPPFGLRIRDRHRRWFDEGQSHPLKTLGGKSEGRDYMQALGYQVPQLYAQIDRITDLPNLSDLPPRFLLKPEKGHSVQNVFPVEDGRNLLDGSPLGRSELIAKVGKDSSGSFLVEELLRHYDGRPGLPYDYKFNCFGGRIASIIVIERNSLTRELQNRYWYLTNDWALLPFRAHARFYHERTLPPKPDCLDEMVALVRDVGARLNCYVRIDLYATSRGPVFGEFTAFPHMGYGYTPQGEAYLGAMWRGLDG